MYTLEYLDTYIEKMIADTRDIICINNYVLISMLAILLVGNIIKMLLFKDDKLEVKKNVWNTIKLLFVYIITGSITLICSFAYNLEKSITSNLSSDVFIVVSILLIGYCIIVGLISALYFRLIKPAILKNAPITVPKIKEFFELRINILKDEFSKEEDIK